MSWPGFVNPWMLAGLVAVGLPVLVHFLTRARPRRVVFPPFRFLVEASAGQQALHRLRTWLVLVLRTLAVLALVLLFARPFSKPRGGPSAAEAARRVVLLLDASLSMRAVERGTPLFRRAQSEAAEVLRRLEPGSEAAVVLVGATPRPLLPALSANLPALHEALVQAEPTYEIGGWPEALALTPRLLGGRSGTVYLFSDFQKSNWGATNALPAGCVCRLRPVTERPVENLAVTAARVVPAAPFADEAVEVVCTLFNSSAAPRQGVVRLELGDFTPEAQVRLPPFGTGEAVFSVRFPQPGVFTGRVSLPPDDLVEDNERHLAVRVEPELEVLVVSEAELSDRRSGAFFLARALVPSTNVAPGLRLTRRQMQELDRGALERAGIICFVAPAALTGETLEIVERRVRDGARYLGCLDGPTSRLLVPAAFEPPFRLVRSVASAAGDTVRPGVRAVFAELDSADWATLLFRRHEQNQVLPGREDDVWLSYPDGSAALTCHGVGKGAAAFWNLPLTLDAGDLVGHPLFPSLVHETVRRLRQDVGDPEATPGFAWALEVPASGEGSVAVRDPLGQPVEAAAVLSGRVLRLALPVARRPGAYAARRSDALIGAGVVNVDPRESDLRAIPPDTLGAGAAASVQVVRGDLEGMSPDAQRPWWPKLALAAGAFLGLEMLVLTVWRKSTSGARGVEPPRTPASGEGPGGPGA